MNTIAHPLKTATRPPLILASGSPRRRELLSRFVKEFLVVTSDVSETHSAGVPPRRLCELNAERKALAIAERYPSHLVLGADTLVFLEGRPLGKPADMMEARDMLSQLSGRVHEVITGVCLVCQQAKRMRLFAESTRVKFRELSTLDITEYLSRVHVLDKAGSYALQEHGGRIIERVEGSESNVVGLPMEAVRKALEQW
ncbi:MAG: septum formation protein Maf [Pedosphaera sp.]|nr:septum formation protein Maf [Pedosphaera sp.]